MVFIAKANAPSSVSHRNASYFAWNCSEGPQTSAKVFDTNAWTERDLIATTVTAPAISPIAVEGGFMWSEPVSETRRMTLFTLTR